MIVADTSAMIALMNADDQYHDAMLQWYEADPEGWLIPWAVLPELDYMLLKIDARAERDFLSDLADARWTIEWSDARDLVRACDLNERYRSLEFGLTDAIGMAVAERRKADAIATLDLRHFGAAKLTTEPLLLPRDG